MTIEAQNALLKCIEEAGDNIHFLFCSENEDDLLSTIVSRSRVIKLRSEIIEDAQIHECVTKLTSMERVGYEEIDILCQLAGKNLNSILVSLRTIMLDELITADQRLRCIFYCKRLLPAISLSEINNISQSVVLESVFLRENTP